MARPSPLNWVLGGPMRGGPMRVPAKMPQEERMVNETGGSNA
jgi:hypothetical protein